MFYVLRSEDTIKYEGPSATHKFFNRTGHVRRALKNNITNKN